MTEQQRLAFVFAQSVAAMAEIESMKALNTYREMRGETIAYNEEAFLGIIDKYGLGHNDLISQLTGH